MSIPSLPVPIAMNYSFFFDALFVDAFLFLTPPRTITPWPCLSNELVAKSDRFVGSLQKMMIEHVPSRTLLTYSIKAEQLSGGCSSDGFSLLDWESCWLRRQEEHPLLMIRFCFPTCFFASQSVAAGDRRSASGPCRCWLSTTKVTFTKFVSYLHNEKEHVFANLFLSSIKSRD